jgi:hypothetical protein
MAQASVLTDTEMRGVSRIIETTRHANRNCLPILLSTIMMRINVWVIVLNAHR